MFKQREAIIRLLKDSDPETVNLTKQQLAQGGSEAIPDLRDLLQTDDQQVAVHVVAVLTEIETREAQAGFEEICEKISTLGDLEQGCWYLAQIFQPGVDVESYQKTIDTWGQQLRERLTLCHSENSRAVAMGQFFGKDLGLRGN